MTILRKAGQVMGLALIVACVAAGSGAARADEHREHEYRDHEYREHEFHDKRYIDARYHHDHYYPPRGYVFGGLPAGYVAVSHQGVHLYFGAGIWYRPEPGGRFVVIAPPIGIVVPILPPYYTPLWVRGVPYYYANDVYYVRAPQGYMVVEPPPPTVVVEQPPSSTVIELPPGAAVAQAPAPQLFVYPRQGQNDQQQAKDRYECDRWAVGQTGYDPSLAPAGGAPAAQVENYRRAISACLDARGYTVK